MAEEVTCPDCGESFDKRGLTAHRHYKHPDSGPEAVADGGQAEPVTVDRDDLDVDADEIEAAVPGAQVTDDAITFRSIQEIEVADEEMKRELLEELKEYIRGSTLRV